MIKAVLFLILIAVTIPGHSHTPGEQFDYSVVFGGCFENDIVELHINKVAVFKNYTLHNQNTSIKGGLSLTQSGKHIIIFYNNQTKRRRAIKTEPVLAIDLIINKEVNHFKIDLRKGKILLFDYCKQGSKAGKELTIEQVQEPTILM